MQFCAGVPVGVGVSVDPGVAVLVGVGVLVGVRVGVGELVTVGATVPVREAVGVAVGGKEKIEVPTGVGVAVVILCTGVITCGIVQNIPGGGVPLGTAVPVGVTVTSPCKVALGVAVIEGMGNCVFLQIENEA